MAQRKASAKLLVECGTCEAQVVADVEGSYSRFNAEEDAMPERISLLSCPRCSRPIVVSEEWVGQSNGQDVWDDPWRLYPPSEKGLSQPTPQALRTAFSEAQRCFRVKAYTASAVMCRKTLEGACKEHGAKARTLMGALEQLKDRGIIDNRLYEWSDALRITGNDAAHGVDLTVSRDDARDVLDFTEAIVDYLFAYRQRFDEFRARRDKAQQRRKAKGIASTKQSARKKPPPDHSTRRSS